MVPRFHLARTEGKGNRRALNTYGWLLGAYGAGARAAMASGRRDMIEDHGTESDI
jgi:hypothetical protein